VDVDIRELAETMIREGSFDDNQLGTMEEGAFLDLYFIENSELVSDFIVYSSSGASAEEVAVVQAADEEAVAEIESSIKKRLERMKEGVENYREFFGDDYVSGEMPKLNNAVLVMKGRYLIMCASKDNARIRGIIEESFK
jgi:hypothetical protein